MQLAVEERCEFIPFQSPKSVQTNGKKITGMTFCRNEPQEDGSWKEDSEQVLKMKTDFIISAFGSGLYDKDGRQGNRIRATQRLQMLQKFTSIFLL